MPDIVDIVDADGCRENSHSLIHQQKSASHHKHSKLAMQDQSTATQDSGNDRNPVTASSAPPTPTLIAQQALNRQILSSSSPNIPPLSYEAIPVTTRPSTPYHPSEEINRTDMVVVTHPCISVERLLTIQEHQRAEDSSSWQVFYDTPEPITTTGEETTVSLAGQKCLRGTASQNDLMNLIEKHVKNPDAIRTNKLIQVMELASAVLDFYQTMAQPPNEKPHKPTLDDVREKILRILEDKSISDHSPMSDDGSMPDDISISQGILCMNILEKIDDWYGSLGWATPLETLHPGYDSGVFLNMSQSSQTPGIPGNPNTGLSPQEKRTRDQTSLTVSRSKRPRMDSVENQMLLTPQRNAPDISSQNMLQGSPQPRSTPKPKMKACLYPRCRGRTKDVRGMMKHITESHFPQKVFLCHICYEMFSRKDQLFANPGGHYHDEHKFPRDIQTKFKLEENMIIIEIGDTFCKVCPVCREDVSLNSHKEYMEHIKKHFEGELLNHTYQHRCDEITHDWRNSERIPVEFRPKPDGKKRPRRSCTDIYLDLNDDQDNNDEDHSDLSRSGGSGFLGQPGSSGSGNEGSQNASSNVSSNNYAGGSQWHCSEFPHVLFCFEQKSGILDPSHCEPSEMKKSTRAVSGIGFVKKFFKPIRKLGRGGSGTVDEVLFKPTNKTCARKIIPFSQIATKVSAEVEILKQLRHPHIISLVAYCITSDELWLFMTPVAEKDLATYLRVDAIQAAGIADRERLRNWESCLASALKYLHVSGFVHGDIKPQNVLISFDLKIYLADFGSARAKSHKGSGGIEARLKSTLTPKYSAPEVSYYKSVSYSWEIRAAADIFSLGCVWVEMETVYTGLSIQEFESFRSGGSAYNSFQANLPRTYLWIDFLWVHQQSVLQPSRYRKHAPGNLQTARLMLSFDPDQRPSADKLTAVFHCICSVDTRVLGNFDVLREKSPPFSMPLSKGGMFHWTDDHLHANQISMTLPVKPSNCWKTAVEGFSTNCLIDKSYIWDISTTCKQYSPWLGDKKISVSLTFFGNNANDSEPLSGLSNFYVLVGRYAESHDIVIRQDFLQVSNMVVFLARIPLTSSRSELSNV